MTLSIKSFQGISTPNSLSHLLPYDPASKLRLKDGLKEQFFLLTVTKDAIESLQRGELTSFDPLVGENSCQIRAVKIALIANHCFSSPQKLAKEIDSLKTKITELSNANNISKNEISLKDYIEKEQLDIFLSEDEIFLLESYILTKTKITKPFDTQKPLVENASTDTKKIREISDISSSFANELVKKLRKDLSARSVTSIQEMASDPTKEIVSNEFIVMHNGLQCLPYYWLTRIVMQQALKHNIPIILVGEQIAKDQNFATIQQTSIFFKATPERYHVTSRDSLSPQTLALILFGKTCKNYNELPEKQTWIQQLKDHDPMDFILAYAAAHRQYPDESKDSLLDNIEDENYTDHKMKAEKWGCTIKNPSLFFLSHAFCDRVENIEEK